MELYLSENYENVMLYMLKNQTYFMLIFNLFSFDNIYNSILTK